MGNVLEIEEDFCCDVPAPKKIEFGFSHFAGMWRATCKNCSYVNSYWECACELEHDCEEN
jgi:hypothetical protein